MSAYDQLRDLTKNSNKFILSYGPLWYEQELKRREIMARMESQRSAMIQQAEQDRTRKACNMSQKPNA